MTPAVFRWHVEQAVEVKKEVPELICALLGVKTEGAPKVKKEENLMDGLMKLSAMGFGAVRKCKR